MSSWTKDTKVSTSKRIVDTMHPAPLRDKLVQTVYGLNMVSRKLEDSKLRIDRSTRPCSASASRHRRRRIHRPL